MTKDKRRDKKIPGIEAEERYIELKEMTTEEWNVKLEKNKAKTGKVKRKKQRKKVHGKVVYGATPEERFLKVHGMTIEEWDAKKEEKFKDETGMSGEEWYIKKVNSSTPIDYLKNRNDSVSEDDVELVKDLQELGLSDGVINVLLDYVELVSRTGLIHSLVRKMGESWLKENILTIESAIAFVREKWKN